eukprot:TRINITY_DN2447_c0_g1_i7.p1 TRINITY_DN2447_c0_g1~~TRINITY_DN2447_c0_g1_i7.p1  ORF type:complete len:209 (+),score=32.55 TRINITY_DN2447_c0_g1_i7:305-931(+)
MNELVQNLKNFLFAGYETSSVACTWTILLLLQNPQVEEILVKEIVCVLGKDLKALPTIEDLDKMKYLNQVVKESMKVRPPVHSTFRTTDCDTTLGGYNIPARTTFNISIYAMHHLPNLWNEPDEFKPERWEDNNESHAGYYPFVHGTRNCIGQRFALLEIKTILCMVLKSFKFTLPADHPKITRAQSVTMKPYPYVKVHCALRNLDLY